ncbi:leucine-rich repeat-containing protein 74B-like [Gigantopelta aegis]|uniref:leucine-rich repeat-containing protein 74B-like n=1 Tax=Gigantopelta aegis TaxID=1735272 RepID=UPI001B8890C6|nr:leucine-rich repeat-containing protein 74B-like [Gigantopelta aegis]
MGVVPSTTFKRCYHLPQAMLNYQGLTSKGTRAVCLALVSNAVVSELLLAGNAIGTYGLQCIVDMLKHNTTIQVLDVSDNDLGSAGASLLADLISNTTLASLKASGNHFKGTDAKYFSQAIQKNTTLKHLDLSHNEFTEKGGILLGRSIGENECLESVNLSWNHLRLTGIAGIAEGIKANVSIKKLNVSWNGIGNDGARVLGRALRDNWILEELDVSSSRIGFEGLRMLFAGMVGNETLKRLILTKNPITSSGACVALRLIQSTPSFQIKKLEMADLSVTSEFLDLLSELHKTKPDFVAVYGGILRNKDMILDTLAKHSDIRDPLEIFMEFIKQNNLRLMDMFTRLDKDKNFSISRLEFERGIKDAEIPLDGLQMDKLINRLDFNGDGEIDFGELLDGYHQYVQRRRKKRKDSEYMQALSNQIRPISSRSRYVFRNPSRPSSPSYDSDPNSRPVTPHCINLSGPLGNRDEFIMSLNHLPNNRNHFLNVSDMNVTDVNALSDDSDDSDDTGCEIQVPQLYDHHGIGDLTISDW